MAKKTVKKKDKVDLGYIRNETPIKCGFVAGDKPFMAFMFKVEGQYDGWAFEDADVLKGVIAMLKRLHKHATS